MTIVGEVNECRAKDGAIGARLSHHAGPASACSSAQTKAQSTC